jgi:hypothetical protein
MFCTAATKFIRAKLRRRLAAPHDTIAARSSTAYHLLKLLSTNSDPLTPDLRPLTSDL